MPEEEEEDDSGESAIWRAHKEHQAAKRAGNRIASTELLRAEGFSFTLHNGGAHLIVEQYVDFWPGTGLFRNRHTGRKGRGVRNLVNYLKDNSK